MEELIVVGEGTSHPLQGIRQLPDPVANVPVSFPAVVFVHGSGSSDRDESIYSNKPFRDLAEGLADQGIASIRFDKRSLTYGRQMVKQLGPKMTLEQESIEDAIMAANMLKSDPRINADKVFIIGHSQGGMIAPRIDAEGGNFAGLIIMAGSPRLLREILMDQNAAMLKQLKGPLRWLAKKQIKKMGAKLDAIPTMTEDGARNTKVLNGIYASYFKDMEDHPVSKYLSELTKPILIMQGEKDFQVSVEKDFDAYKTLCKDMPNVEFKLYPGLNHLFMPSTYGTVNQFKKEYKIPSHVDATVINDIATWIHAH